MNQVKIVVQTTKATIVSLISHKPNLVKFLQAQGGAHTLEDFAEFEPDWV